MRCDEFQPNSSLSDQGAGGDPAAGAHRLDFDQTAALAELLDAARDLQGEVDQNAGPGSPGTVTITFWNLNRIRSCLDALKGVEGVDLAGI